MTAVAALMLLPLLWSALVFAIRAFALRGRPALSDAAEKTVLALMLLPLAAGAAALALPVPAPHAITALMPHLPVFEPQQTVPASGPEHHALPAGWLLPRLLLALWMTGGAVALGRLARAHLRFARAAVMAEHAGDGVYVTSSDVPAFAWNGRRIVIPVRLHAAVSAEQLALIIAHERAHQRRCDPAWFLVLGVIEAVLWINPVIRSQARACRLAAELACDDAVTRAVPGKRRAYAEALLRTVSGAAPASIPALSDFATCKMRLETIMTSATPPKGAVLVTALVCLTVPAAAAEMVFAQGAPAAPPVIRAVLDIPAAPATGVARPVDAPVSAGFGVRLNPLPGERKLHIGLDFAAPLGTPVKAHADGTVTRAEQGTPGYGTQIEIDNGGGVKTRYAHLGRLKVKAGDHVAAGQVIADIGTPVSGSPHLHFELWQNGKPVDPAPLFDGASTGR